MNAGPPLWEPVQPEFCSVGIFGIGESEFSGVLFRRWLGVFERREQFPGGLLPGVFGGELAADLEAFFAVRVGFVHRLPDGGGPCGDGVCVWVDGNIAGVLGDGA